VKHPFPAVWVFVLAGAWGTSGEVRAQSLEEKRAQKLASAFLKKAPWVTDYEAAMAAAKEKSKPILGYFTRSYAACPPCLQLEGGALLTDEFAKLAEKYVLFCHITTQIPGEKHGDLLSQKGGEGFPHVVFMDAEGKVLAEHEGPRSAEGFDATGAKASAFIALRDQAAKGDKKAEADLLVKQLELGHLEAAEAAKKADGMNLSKEQKAAFEAALAEREILGVLQGIRDDEGANAAGKSFFDRYQAGKPAPVGDQAVQGYWILLMGHAEDAKDVSAFEAGLKALKAKFGNVPQAQAFFKKQEATLEKLKGGAK
jgi:hypothetical protein